MMLVAKQSEVCKVEFICFCIEFIQPLKGARWSFLELLFLFGPPYLPTYWNSELVSRSRRNLGNGGDTKLSHYPHENSVSEGGELSNGTVFQKVVNSPLFLSR